MQLMGTDRYPRSVMLLTLGIIPSTVHEASADPSFDCDRPTTPDEKAFCDDGTPSQMDSMFASAYRMYKPEFRSKGSVARRLLHVSEHNSFQSRRVSVAKALEKYCEMQPTACNA